MVVFYPSYSCMTSKCPAKACNLPCMAFVLCIYSFDVFQPDFVGALCITTLTDI